MNRCRAAALVAAILTLSAASLAQTLPWSKKLIEYGWDVPTPAEMREHLAEMEKRPFDGIIFRLSGGYNAFQKSPLDTAKLAEDEKILRNLRFHRFTDNFVLVWGSAEEGWDWFDDSQWKTVEENGRLLARIGRVARVKGICFDPEPYAFNPWDYSKQAGASSHTFAEFRQQARSRGARFMRALEKEMPATTILTFFHVSLVGNVMDEPDPKILESKLQANRWGLMPDFLIGMLEGASPGARFIDGNEVSYYYTGREPFFRAYHTMVGRALHLLPPNLRDKYRLQVRAGQALYVDHLFALRQPNPTQYLSFKLTPDERTRWFEHNAYYALYTTDQYVWCYSERMSWWKNQTPPGLEDAILRARRKIAEGHPLGFEIEPLLTEAAKRP